jgi:hypothetical protein
MMLFAYGESLTDCYFSGFRWVSQYVSFHPFLCSVFHYFFTDISSLGSFLVDSLRYAVNAPKGLLGCITANFSRGLVLFCQCAWFYSTVFFFAR